MSDADEAAAPGRPHGDDARAAGGPAAGGGDAGGGGNAGAGAGAGAGGDAALTSEDGDGGWVAVEDDDAGAPNAPEDVRRHGVGVFPSVFV